MRQPRSNSLIAPGQADCPTAADKERHEAVNKRLLYNCRAPHYIVLAKIKNLSGSAISSEFLSLRRATTATPSYRCIVSKATAALLPHNVPHSRTLSQSFMLWRCRVLFASLFGKLFTQLSLVRTYTCCCNSIQFCLFALLFCSFSGAALFITAPSLGIEFLVSLGLL